MSSNKSKFHVRTTRGKFIGETKAVEAVKACVEAGKKSISYRNINADIVSVSVDEDGTHVTIRVENE